jgi:serine phosphatase RsbU (regulator of sigma subunit)/anti-sigma regulatory factor (Ser/Thr protein kinase)
VKETGTRMQAQAELVLGDEPEGAAHARRFVVVALDGFPPEVVEDARLVVTELVTNAQLYGEPPVVLRVEGDAARVRVAVSDTGRQMPVLPLTSTDAMTGRGLALVRALAAAWGVDPAPSGGKAVWADLDTAGAGAGDGEGDAEDTDLDALLAAWPDEEPQPGDELHLVRLGAVPTALLLDAKRHIDNVVRELTLERAAAVAGQDLPAEFASLIETVTGDFAGPRAEIKRQALAAAARGDKQTDLVLRLDVSAAEAGERYVRALDEADRYARAARLLTLESPPLHRVFRTWYVQTLVALLRARSSGEPYEVRPFVEVLGDEVTALSSLREAEARLKLLQKVNAELTTAVTKEEIAQVVAGNATDVLGALSVSVYLSTGGVLRSIASRGGHGDWVSRYQQIPLDAELPGPIVFRTGRPMVLRNRTQLVERFPELAGAYATERALHVVPLTVGRHRLGVLSLAFPFTGEFDEETQSAFVRALADALAQALDRAEANERLGFLADASMALSASLDFEQTVEAVTGLLVPRLADWCALQVVQEGRLQTVGLQHTDPAKVEWVQRMSERYPPKMDAPSGAPRVIRTGRAELYPEIPDELLTQVAIDEEHLEILRTLGMSSAMVVALPGRTGIIGALTLVYAESGRRYTEADVTYAEDVARRAALAIETARVLRDQSGRLRDVTRVADAAQKAILAPPPARIGPVALAARYVSAAAEALVGGDLYETVAREGAVRLLIGDVRGKGLTAVRTATVVLGEFRAAAADVDDLAEVARQVDRRLRAYLGDEDFVTALMAEIRDDGGWTIACCGHPPALLASRGTITRLEGAPSLPLGLGADPVACHGRLEVGDRLLLYTDGVLEARDAQHHFVDVMQLVRPLSTGRLEDVLDEVLDALHDAVGPELGDDLALLVAEYVGPG